MNKMCEEPVLIRLILKKRKAFAEKLLDWAMKNPCLFPWRKNSDPYSILVSELLLRKTRADKVGEIFPKFIIRFPTVNILAASTEDQIRREIYPLGRLQRDRKILEIARIIDIAYSGVIPNSEDQLFKIVGSQSRYTVNAIRCFAFGERLPVFDVNVNRIISRIFSADLGSQPHKSNTAWRLTEMLLPAKRIKEFNWALLDLGRTVCTSKPRCGVCPLSDMCNFALRNNSSACV